jgi:hypothetical protein
MPAAIFELGIQIAGDAIDPPRIALLADHRAHDLHEPPGGPLHGVFGLDRAWDRLKARVVHQPSIARLETGGVLVKAAFLDAQPIQNGRIEAVPVGLVF